MTTDTTLEELIRRGPTGMQPWSAEDAAELGAYTYRAAVFLPGDATKAARLSLQVALVVHLGERGALLSGPLAEATEAVVTALSLDSEPEDAFAVGLTTYRQAWKRGE